MLLGISVWQKRVPFVKSSFQGSQERPGHSKHGERYVTGDKDEKSVNGTQISIGKTGLPFQKFRLFRKIFCGTNQKVVFHLHLNRNFRNFLVKGKRSLPLTTYLSQKDVLKGGE